MAGVALSLCWLLIFIRWVTKRNGFWKMAGKLLLISQFQSPPPPLLSLPSCFHYPPHLPQSFSSQSTPQHHPPLSALYPTCFWLLLSLPVSLPFRIFVASSFLVPSRPSTCCPVHLAPFSLPLPLFLVLLSSSLDCGPSQHSSHPLSVLTIHRYQLGEMI